MYSKSLDRQKKYEKDFNTISKPLPSLISAFHSFQRALREVNIASELELNEHPFIISALLSSMLINYSKPFLQGTDKNHTVVMSQKYLTKNSLFDSNIHVSLLELRNDLVAHANRDFEKQEFRIISALVESNVANSKARQIHLPMKLLAHNESLLTINPKMLNTIKDHLQKTLSLTDQEIKRNLLLIKNIMLQYLDIANSVNEVISLDGQEISTLGERVLQNLAFQDIEQTVKLKLGKNMIVMEHFHIAVDIPREDFENDLFKITCTTNQKTGLTNFQIQFKI